MADQRWKGKSDNQFNLVMSSSNSDGSKDNGADQFPSPDSEFFREMEGEVAVVANG